MFITCEVYVEVDALHSINDVYQRVCEEVLSFTGVDLRTEDVQLTGNRTFTIIVNKPFIPDSAGAIVEAVQAGATLASNKASVTFKF